MLTRALARIFGFAATTTLYLACGSEQEASLSGSSGATDPVSGVNYEVADNPGTPFAEVYACLLKHQVDPIGGCMKKAPKFAGENFQPFIPERAKWVPESSRYKRGIFEGFKSYLMGRGWWDSLDDVFDANVETRSEDGLAWIRQSFYSRYIKGREGSPCSQSGWINLFPSG